jgi:hypothetical protein
MNSIRYQLARRRMRLAILATNSGSSASMRSDIPESRFPIFIAIRITSTLSTLSTSSTSTFSTLLRLLSKIQRLTISLVWRERCPCRTCKDVTQMRGRRYATGSQIHPQVEQVVPRSAVPQGIWTVGFRALWLLAGA